MPILKATATEAHSNQQADESDHSQFAHILGILLFEFFVIHFLHTLDMVEVRGDDL